MALKPKINLSIMMAVAGLPAMVLLLEPASARAQHYIGQDGHALDANPMVGSGGRNGYTSNRAPNQASANNDNIITGNVSGLNFFHAASRRNGVQNLATYDPNVFQGGGGGFSPSDRLNAIAAPVDLTQRTTGTPNYTPYYVPQNYTAKVPENFTTTPGGATGYVPAPTVSPLTPSTDIRPDVINNDPTKGDIPLPGELNVSGPVDPTGAAAMYSMSPLYGVRPMDNTSAPGTADTLFLSKQTNTLLPNTAAGARLTPAQIQQLRAELNKTVVPEGQVSGKDNSNNTINNTTATPNLDKNSQVNGAAITGQLSPQPINSSVSGNQPASGDLSTGQGLQSNLLIPAGKQSKQLKALEDKYAKLNHKLTDEEAAQRLNEEQRALHANTPLDKNSKKPAQPTAAPGVGAANPFPMASNSEPATRPTLKPILTSSDTAADNQPYVITSLATGIQAKGLADLLKSGEDKMRQGKFTEAVDTYETAQSVAPNNPFVSLGRSFAELGASYYGKADQDLTRSIILDPAVLAGKYDLNGFLGEDRVKFVTKDLTDIASHEKSGRPLVLLGFIAHNTGDDAAAVKYLDQASPRGGYDSLIALMRSSWSLKANAK